MLSTVLITGCTKDSIGYHLAKEFARQDYHVFATSRRPETMGDLGADPNIRTMALDVTKRESIQSVHDEIAKETNGKLDILYHNAGYRVVKMSLETSAEEAFRTLNTNFLSIVEMNGVFADLLIASIYKYVDGTINNAITRGLSTAIKGDAYAKTVVGGIIKPNPSATVWAGGDAFNVWMLEVLNLSWLFPHVLVRMFGLNSPAVSVSVNRGDLKPKSQ
ncbi:MAG: NADPH-dependent 1-acyl dihydroxyacetone phosphate reductase [Pycnora praestabilis]|nr:MAG: NADPH-dependent 1-acyl dihydroxyacetone phosphate reductase [Pycnora praestabilis]